MEYLNATKWRARQAIDHFIMDRASQHVQFFGRIVVCHDLPQGEEMKRWPWIVGGVVFIAIMFALQEGLWWVADNWGAWPIIFMFPCLMAYGFWYEWNETKKRATDLELEIEYLRRRVRSAEEETSWLRHRDL